MRNIYVRNGHIPHKGLVSAGFDECGVELDAKGKVMVLEGGPSQIRSETLQDLALGVEESN